jgi:hypothetical protein
MENTHCLLCRTEEVSGLPTLCRPLAEGGLGFQYRLGMLVKNSRAVRYLYSLP